MTAVRKQRRRRRPIYIAALTVLTAGLVIALGASAANSIGGNFEIDANANLVVNDPAPSIDWARSRHARSGSPTWRPASRTTPTAEAPRKTTPVRVSVTGSIPNNKSDLLNFGVVRRAEVGGPGFLNMFWNRVSEPSGTTLMDFELNKSGTHLRQRRQQGPHGWATFCSSTPSTRAARSRRSPLASGTARRGARRRPSPARRSARSTSPRSSRRTRTVSGAMNARTFGEMSLDLDFIFDSGMCERFGSAMVKSRSSDSFTSQLKDFIRPVPVNISNCAHGDHPQADRPGREPEHDELRLHEDVRTGPATANTFTLADDGRAEVQRRAPRLRLHGDRGRRPVRARTSSTSNCSASTGVTPPIIGATVTFGLDSAADVLDCTYTNRARGTIIVEKITTDGQGAFGFTSNTLPRRRSPSRRPLRALRARTRTRSRTSNPGTYDVAETEPAGLEPHLGDLR